MTFVELSKYLRQMRANRSGRPFSAAMRAMEVWQCAIECESNGVAEIIYSEVRLPRPFDGVFSRHRPIGGGGDLVEIFVHRPNSKAKQIPSHWKEFIVIKELMHCWSPASTFQGTPAAVSDLVNDLNTPASRYGTGAAADQSAIFAASEVILDHETVERSLAEKVSLDEIAVRHGLHPEIVNFICQHHFMAERKSGRL